LLHTVVIVLALLPALPVHGQQTPPKAPAAEADIDETAQADLYYRLGNLTAALPLYERLAAQTPQSAVFAERFAYCLSTKATLLPIGDERTALLARAKKEAERAKSLGDNSPLLQIILESVSNPQAARHQYEERMAKAEAAFTKGDLDTALAAYQEIAASDPTSYDAPLFAGDVYFRRGDTQHAGEWFQKAIDVDPNRETAYRYWGDALVGARQNEEALAKFIEAIVAEPYSRRAWLGLQQWAGRNGVTIKPPHLEVPSAPTVQPNKKKNSKELNVTVTVSPDQLQDANGAGVWLAYSASRALWRAQVFAKRFPDEKEYRHTLAEEVEALRTAVKVLDELKVPEERLDANLRMLAVLGKAQMFEPYVLLSAADEGIAQDYDAYRDAHRDVVRTYIKEHVLHREDAKK